MANAEQKHIPTPSIVDDRMMKQSSILSAPGAGKDAQGKEPQLALRIEYPEDCLAGTFVVGRVYLVLPSSSSSKNNNIYQAKAKANNSSKWQGIHVRLEGSEHSTMVVPGGAVASKENPLMLTEQPIVLWTDANHPDSTRNDFPTTTTSAAPGKHHHHHLEYPFRWRLPENLPASMYCSSQKSKTNHCRIEYKMTASLVSRLGGEQKIKSNSVVLFVRSQALSIKGQPTVVPKEKFPIKTALVFGKGNMEIGLKLSTDIVSPGASLRVGVYGSNHGKVAVKDFVVRLVERVTWSVDPQQCSMSEERVLCHDKIWTHDATDWQANDERRYREHETLWTMLRIPDRGCRGTYRIGEYIKVEHFVLLIAETSVDKTTNPRRMHAVQMINSSRGDQALQQNAAALVLPTDWSPSVAPVMEIPDILVVPQAQAQMVANSV